MARERVAVLGLGTMGAGIVRALLAANCTVAVFDPDPAAIARLLGTPVGGSSKTVTVHADVSEAVQGVDLVVETVPEELGLKAAVLREAAAATPASTPLGSNTSSLDLDELGRRCDAPTRLPGWPVGR